MLLLCFLLLFTSVQVTSSTTVQAASMEKKETYLIRLKKNLNINQWTAKKGIQTNRAKSSNNFSSTIVTELDQTEFKKMKADSEIEVIEKDQRIQLTSSSSEVENPTSTHSIVPWGVTATQASNAQSQGISGDSIKIAILDTGVSTTHPDLQITGGQTFVSGTTTYEDDNGHGTHVAGIINAMPNEFGIQGMAPNAQVYALKVLDADGTGYYSTVIEAIEWCVANGINIVSMSFGGAEYSEVVHQVIQEASAEYGILFVAAAGNNGNGEEMESYPARYSEVISVGSLNESRTRSAFSSTGNELDLMAPGEQIWSTDLANTYSIRSGTSMAAPYVTGAAALIWSAERSMTADQVKDRLLNNAVPLGDRHEYGAGFVQVSSSKNLPDESPSNPEPTGSVSQQDQAIRGLMRELMIMKKNAMEQDNISLAKEIDSAYNQLKIDFNGFRHVPEHVYIDPSVTSTVYDTPSVTRLVYQPSSVIQSVYQQPSINTYDLSQLSRMEQIIAANTVIAKSFHEQLGETVSDSEKAQTVTTTEDPYYDIVGDWQSIYAGEDAIVSFSSRIEIDVLYMEVTGSDDFYENKQFKLGIDYDNGYSPFAVWKTFTTLPSGDYIIRLSGYNSKTYASFDIYYTICVYEPLVIAESISANTPIDLNIPAEQYKYYKYQSSSNFETLNIQTNFFGGVPGSSSDTVLTVYAYSPEGPQIAYDDESNGNHFSSIKMTIQPSSTIYIKVAGYNNGSVHARFLIEKVAHSYTNVTVNTPVSFSTQPVKAYLFTFTPVITGKYRFFGDNNRRDGKLSIYSDQNLSQLVAFTSYLNGLPQYINADLTAGKTYYVVFSGDANYSWSVSLTVFDDAVSPTAPINLRMTKLSDFQAVLQWNASTDNKGVTYYDIYCGNLLEASVSSNTLSYMITNRSTVNMLLFYRVIARDAAGNVSTASNRVVFLYLNSSYNITYQYDSRGRLSGIRLPSGDVINYQTDNNGNTKQIILP